jgi:hypothetical protein
MKTLLCILLLSAAAFGQMADAQKQGRREKPGCKKIQLCDVSGILPKANGGTGVNSSHAFAQTGVDINTSFQVTALHLATPLGVSQGGTGTSSFPGVLLAPSADQTISGSHYLIFQTGVESLKLFPGFQANHSAFAQGADFYTHADEGFRAPYINFYKSRGTEAAPTPITYTGVYEADSIGGINFGGWDGSSYGIGAAIYTNNDENWTPTAHGAHLSIYGTFSGVLTQNQIIQFGGKDATGTGSPQGNIISMRPISFRGNTPSSPAIYYTLNPPSIKMKTADDSADVPLTVGSLAVTTPHTPATSFEPCDAGTIAWDANFVYVCVAPSTWRRSALVAW